MTAHDEALPGGGTLRIEEVRTVVRLREVAPAWEGLWRRACHTTPFSSPAWLLPWCEHLFEGDEIWALLAWRGKTLAGLLPAFVYTAGSRRVLGLLGGGVSDYQDVLVDTPDVASALLRRVTTTDGGFDGADFESLPPDSLLLSADTSSGAAARVQHDVCPVVPLPARFEDLSSRASSKLLADVRHQRRRMARDGGFELVRAEGGTLEPLLADLFRIHGARWRARGEPGVLRGAELAAFHREAARGLLAQGVLRLYALRWRDRAIATLHGFASHGRAYAYLPAMDPECSRYSPGSVVLAHAVEQAIAEGCAEMDFLRGAEPYKYRWGAEDRSTWRLVAGGCGAAIGAAGATSGAPDTEIGTAGSENGEAQAESGALGALGDWGASAGA